MGSIDAQHRSLLTIGRELCDAISTGQGKAFTYNIVERLAQYATTHFAHEERLMRAHGYPDLAGHKARHAALSAKAVKFRADFKAGRAAVSMEVLQSLENVLVEHFQGADRKLSTFLRKMAAD